MIRGVLPAAMAMLLAASSAQAGRIRIEFDDTAAGAMLDLLEDSRVHDTERAELLALPAYVLVARQLERSLGLPEGEGAMCWDTALQAAATDEPQPGMELEHGRARPTAYRRALQALRREESRLQLDLSRRIAAFLPPRAGLEATVYVIVGGDAVGMTPPGVDAVVLRIDDFVRGAPDHPLDVDAFEVAASHELYHVGFRAAGGPPPRPIDPDEEWITLASVYGADTVGEVWRRADERRWDGSLMAARFAAWVPPDEWSVLALDRLLRHLSRIQAEGCAVLTEGSDTDEAERARWMRNIDADFEVLAELTRLLSRGAAPERLELIAQHGFRNNGPLYRVGTRMAQRIDERFGRRALVASVEEGPLEFVDRYLETQPDGPGHVDPSTERVLRQVIREIRGVGTFDPRE